VADSEDMKNYVSSFVFTVLLAAGLHQVEHAAGLPPSQAKAALQKLRGISSYGWTTTTDMRGPPVTIAPMSGKTVKAGSTVIDWTLNGQRLQAAQRSGFTAIKTNKRWQTSAEIATSTDVEAMPELLTAVTPADELARLLPLMTSFTTEPDGSCVGIMSPESAQDYMMKMSERRSMKPNVTNVSGRLQVWLRDGLPQKYVFTIKATMSLLLMHKDITRTQTVELSGYDAVSVTLPAEALAKLTGQ